MKAIKKIGVFALLLCAVLAAGWMTDKASANPASTGNVSAVYVDVPAPGISTTWTIKFQFDEEVPAGGTVTLRSYYREPSFDMYDIQFSNQTADYALNGTAVVSGSCGYGSCIVTTSAALPANQEHTLSIRNTLVPMEYPGVTFNFWMFNSVDYTYGGTWQLTTLPSMPLPPATPTLVTATGIKSDRVSLSWGAAAGATGYNIYRNGTKLNSMPVASNTYTAEGLTPGTPYQFAVSSWNGISESAVSAPISITPPQPFTLSLGSVSGNAGEDIELPLTLGQEDGLQAMAIQFDLELDPMFLENEEFVDATDMMQINRISDAPRKYRIVIGSSDLTALPAALGALGAVISSGADYQTTTSVNLANIVVAYGDNLNAALPDTSGTVMVADTIAPQLTLTVSTESYVESVGITITVDGTGSDIATLKWAAGEREAAWFETDGTDVHGNAFTVSGTAIGSIFTVYAVDEAGNVAVETIIVDNAVLKGDIDGDGDVDVADWQLAANIILGRITPDARQTFAAEVNGDEVINVADWVLIARQLVA